MVIHAYNEEYVEWAQRILGDAMDFAIMTLEVEPNEFAMAFAVSEASKQFAKGNPRYVAGMNGCELARQVLAETNISYTDGEDAMYMDKSPEFWAGWALAFYQWYSNLSFMEILSAFSMEEIIDLYSVYHEMDVMQFVDRMNEEVRQVYRETKLRMHRGHNGMSQAELAKESGVSIRQIQLFEQRKRDINNTSAKTLLRLSKALHCEMEDLMEYI